MWRLIFLFVLIMFVAIINYPFLLRMEIKFNVLKFKGVFCLILFNKIKITIKFRIKNGYVYIYYKNKERKEKLSNQNVNVILFTQLIKQSYFRQQLLTLGLSSNFGYCLDSCVTATTSGFIDVISKCVLAKIKNNKKSAHIFVDVEPKYNEDIFNFRSVVACRVSLLDMIYTFVYAKIYTWSEYERRKPKTKN